MASHSSAAHAGSSSPSQDLDAVIWKPDLTLTNVAADQRGALKDMLKDITLNRKDVSTFSISSEVPGSLGARMGAQSSMPLQHKTNILVHAAARGDVQFAAQLLKQGGKIEVRNPCGATPLLQVCGQMAIMPSPEVSSYSDAHCLASVSRYVYKYLGADST